MIMKKQALTSVVIPAYNAERFIERTLRSALQQTYSNLQVIVVDDGSTDTTRAIAEAIAATDDRVEIITIPNGGVAKARNAGLNRATGEFVAFLDADDLWHPTKIERQVAAANDLSRGFQAAAVYTWNRSIDSRDQILGYGQGVLLSGYAFARYLYARPIGNGSSILVRREVALEVGGFDSTWRSRGMGGCEDLDFELKIAAKYPITAVGQYLVGYRAHPGSMTNNMLLPMARGAIAIISQHIQCSPELPEWAARCARASISEYALYNFVAARDWSLMRKEFIELSGLDAGRGLEFIKGFFRRKNERFWSMFRSPRTESSDPPSFYDVSPDFDAHYPVSTPQFRDREVIRSLETVDAQLAEYKAQESGAR
ncbi:MAG TPA: glycosyltransferase [Acidisarcina sp.]|nr:glycosyltransferase [Acidisarcina sp.]